MMRRRNCSCVAAPISGLYTSLLAQTALAQYPSRHHSLSLSLECSGVQLPSSTVVLQRRFSSAAAPPPPRQGLSVVLQSEDPESTLFARAGYALFVLARCDDSLLALFCPTTSKVLTLHPSDVTAAIAFIESNTDSGTFTASIVFPEDSSPILTTLCKQMKEASSKCRVVLGPGAWSIVYDAFRAQREHVRGLTLPDGFEHAAVLMSNKRFSPLHVPQSFQTTSVSNKHGGGGAATDECLVPIALTAADIDRNIPVRRALVVWDALLGVHKRFGVIGSKKLQNPIDAVVRRAVKAVNIFGVDLDNRLGRGSVVEGVTMVATIYNAQTGTNTVHQIRNLSDETIKLNTLTALLYGEGTSSMTVLVPSPRTKEQQLTMFARICKPKCPFFVIQASELAPVFNVPAAAFNFPETFDPKVLFHKTLTTCLPGVLKKDEAVESVRVIKAFTHLAQKKFDRRFSNAVNTFKSASFASVPHPKPAQEDFERQQQFAATRTADGQSGVPQKQTVYLNSVAKDPEVAMRLEEWVDTIYNNPDRLKREEDAVRSISRFLVVDLETTTKKRYKRIANPFTKENYVVMSGALDYKGNIFLPTEYFSKDVSQAYHQPDVCSTTFTVQQSSKRSIFLPPLDDYDVLVGHNFKFDMLHIWRDAELQAFLLRGGKIWDTMYGEYLLTGHQVKLGRGAGLEDVAKSYGGQIPKLDLVKKAWASGKETFEIPYATLKEYLIGDLKNTALVFSKHLERALTQRQAIICCARMDSLLATTEMEFNGLKIDVPLAIRQSNELVGKAVKMRREMDSFIPDEIPQKLRRLYNWASNSMLIPFFFGGRVKLSTGNRESKPVPGEKTERHLLFSVPADYPAAQFPDGVFITSTENSAGSGDCVAVTSCGDAEKGTRVFTSCIDGYMRECGFRKSSTIADSLSKSLVPVSRSTGKVVGAPDAVVNLLPDRAVFIFAAASLDRLTGKLEKLTFLHSETKEETEIDCNVSAKRTAAEVAEDVDAYLRGVATSSTLALLAQDDMIDPSMKPDAFVDAQVYVIARDAPFSFRRLLDNHSAELRNVIAHRVGGSAATTTRRSPANEEETVVVPSAGNAASLDLSGRFAISLADATSTLLYYYAQHAEDTLAAMKQKGSKSLDDATLEGLVIHPAWLPSSPKGKKGGPLTPTLTMEAREDPSVWCKRYRDMFEHIALKTLELETKRPLEPKKARKNSPPPKDDAVLPLLLRRRPVIASDLAAMESTRRLRISLMMLLGRMVGTVYDAMVEPTPFDSVVEIPLKGKLAQYFGTDSSREMDLITAKFRSPITRQLQVGDESLNYFAKTHNDPTASTIMELRGMDKLIGTYYEHTEGGTGMVSLTHSIDSCIHHELVHNKTNTGRLASANPNCQNIPKEDKSPLREMFVSRFPGGKCIEVDYSQLEVITLAALSNDRQMIEDLKNNIDFHCKRVTMIRPDLSYQDVVQRAKKNKEPEFVKLRQQAKIFSFQRQYGAGVGMLSQSTGLSPDEVRQLIEREKEIYKGCDQFTSMVTLSANNYDASLQDGSRNIRGHQVYKGAFPVITGSQYVFTESDMPEVILQNKPASAKSTNFSPTHIKNYPVQGFAGEIVQIMLGRLWRHFVSRQNYNNRALLTNTVHDCVWVDAQDDIFIEVARDVERILSSAREELDRLFPEMKCGVSFGVDVVAGENMCHLRPVPKSSK